MISLLLTVGSLVQQEYILTGSLAVNRSRFFSPNEQAATNLERVFYTVTDPDGATLMQVYLFPILRVVWIILVFLIGLQALSILFSWFGENRRIRRILAPLNDLALRADELNRLSFGEDKYQMIESERLSLGDDDLRGIEAAMNNLLTRMREANMQQARFVNDASHELRTPIAVIRGYADMLERWGKEDEKVLEESIAAIRHESEHMGYLVEQLLFLARGDAGKTQLQLEETELNAFMREIYEESLMIDEAHPYRFVPYSGESALSDDVTTPDQSAEQKLVISVDCSLLKQAVRILVDNAAKYTEPGDEIVLSVGNTWLQVQDTGCGMQDSDITHIFERFYRSEDVRQTKGTGLGLSIAKWIVDKHGAHFEVLSRTGLGTRIRVVL